MIAYVFLAQPARAKNSTELDLAYESLCRALPDGATLVHLDAVDAIGRHCNTIERFHRCGVPFIDAKG